MSDPRLLPSSSSTEDTKGTEVENPINDSQAIEMVGQTPLLQGSDSETTEHESNPPIAEPVPAPNVSGQDETANSSSPSQSNSLSPPNSPPGISKSTTVAMHYRPHLSVNDPGLQPAQGSSETSTNPPVPTPSITVDGLDIDSIDLSVVPAEPADDYGATGASSISPQSRIEDINQASISFLDPQEPTPNSLFYFKTFDLRRPSIRDLENPQIGGVDVTVNIKTESNDNDIDDTIDPDDPYADLENQPAARLQRRNSILKKASGAKGGSKKFGTWDGVFVYFFLLNLFLGFLYA